VKATPAVERDERKIGFQKSVFGLLLLKSNDQYLVYMTILKRNVKLQMMPPTMVVELVVFQMMMQIAILLRCKTLANLSMP
jgi:hypothetical protein